MYNKDCKWKEESHPHLNVTNIVLETAAFSSDVFAPILLWFVIVVVVVVVVVVETLINYVKGVIVWVVFNGKELRLVISLLLFRPSRYVTFSLKYPGGDWNKHNWLKRARSKHHDKSAKRLKTRVPEGRRECERVCLGLITGLMLKAPPLISSELLEGVNLSYFEVSIRRNSK